MNIENERKQNECEHPECENSASIVTPNGFMCEKHARVITGP